MPPEMSEGGCSRRERVRQCGANDVYYAEVPFVMHGDVLHALADEQGHPRPIWPPQVIWTAATQAGWTALDGDRSIR